MTVIGSGKTREAKTTYRTLSASKSAALLACDLHTGRTHQIRVHLHAIGHPILGDPSYMSSLSEKVSDEFQVDQLCLHAWKLMFQSPDDGNVHEITTDPPAAFRGCVERLGLAV